MTIEKGLSGLAALAFVLSVFANFGLLGFVQISSEGYSRASANLALLAVAWAIVDRRRET